MNLIRRLPKPPKRASRWRSQAHCNHVRAHACVIPGCDGRPIEVAHVRIGSGAGMGQKPDDWNTVSLCAEHHRRQHNIGELYFWRGMDVRAIIDEFIRTSPRRAQIDEERASRVR